ncbi:MAG: hypothetical protein M3R08_04445 [Bacteroidota bacterium]|nr:hypothetical protein [Bacteroidota bacterium]
MRYSTLVLLLTFFNSNAQQMEGLDPSFGLGGVVRPMFTVPEVCRSVVVQPDGKILVSGTVGMDAAMDIFVWRLLADGSFDPNWGVNGRVVTNVAGFKDETRKMILQPDGKVLVSSLSRSASSGLGYLRVIRYLPNGAMDPDFGTSGIAITSQYIIRLPDMALQPDGKILIGGGDNTIKFLRLMPDGTLDTTFGVNGVLSSTGQLTGNSVDVGAMIVVRPDGKIVMGVPEEVNDIRVDQYTSSGVLDTDFGNMGSSVFSFPSNWGATKMKDMIIDTDDNILLAAESSYDPPRSTHPQAFKDLPSPLERGKGGEASPGCRCHPWRGFLFCG